MNQKTTYEVTITGKLDQLPIPDLREAIWARIEGELDAEMPTDDGGDTPPSTPRGGGKVWYYALPGLVVLLVTLFLLKPTKPTPQPNTTPVNTPATQTVTTPTASPPPVDIKTITPNQQAPVVYPGTSVSVSNAPNQSDSAAAPVADIVAPITDNTNQQAPLVQTPPPQPVKTDSVVQKKRRGVSGITDDDYRITPIKPDSSRKN